MPLRYFGLGNERPPEGGLVGAGRLELSTLPSPFGDFNVTRKTATKAVYSGRGEARTLDLINVSDAL